MIRIFLVVSMLALNLFAAAGELSLYILKDGKPLSNQHVVIFQLPQQMNNAIDAVQGQPKGTEFTTDNEGYLVAALPEGSYQLQLLARDKGVAQAYVKKNFAIASSKQTQIILSLKSDDSLQFSDTEAPASIKETALPTDKTAQMGSVALTLLSTENAEPVSGARVFIAGLKTDAVTDKKGQVLLDMPEGNQTISIIHTSFSSQSIKVVVLPKEMIAKTVELSPASMELEEFVVLAPHIEGSVASVIAQERNSDAVGNVIGAEQFTKSGDSSAAAALKRVSGVTLVGGKYVYVRGLGERYSTILFNDLHLPSTNPTKRVVPLDIFPTSMIKSITIQKSYTADLPATFGGGTVLIETRDIPENEGYAAIGMAVITNDATGKEAVYNSNNDVPLPSSVISASDNFQNISNNPALTNNVINSRSLNLGSTTIKPGYKLEASAGKSFDVTDDIKVGASGTIYYKNTQDNDMLQYTKYLYTSSGSRYLDSTQASQVTQLNTQTSGIVNVGAEYYGNNKIKYTFFITDKTSNGTYSSLIDYSGSQEDREKTYYEYVEEELMTHQLTGSNELRFANSTDGYFDNLIIDWALEKASAKRLEPGSVEYNYLYQTEGLNWDRKTWYYYFDLEDKVDNYRVDLTLPFEFNENDNYTKMGFFLYNKNRDFDSRRFLMSDPNKQIPIQDLSLSMDDIYSQYGSVLDFTTNYFGADSYTATQEVTALYLKQLLSITKNLDLIVSLRQETSNQQLTDAETGIPYAPLETSDLFPSIGVTYRFNKDQQIRFAYAQTISRPDFREFSPNAYKDPITENKVYGNPNLQATYIDNIDLKYEWYFSPDELFSCALFGKQFTNPIETVVTPYTGGDNTLDQSYVNAQSGQSYGIEIDYRKRFGFISPGLDSLLFATNLAYIQSNIVINRDSYPYFTEHLTTVDRPMQGQSPYVINLQFGYDNPNNGDSALFLFNQYGERIVTLGTYGRPDQYQQPFAKLDFVTRWKLNNYIWKDSDLVYSLKFKAQNLLDSEILTTEDGETVFSMKPGREFELGLNIAY